MTIMNSLQVSLPFSTRGAVLVALFSVIVSASALIGCGSSQQSSTPQPAPQPQPSPRVSEIPEWYLTPPDEEDAIYGAAMGESKDLQIAVNKAEQECRMKVANSIEAKVSSLIKKFDKETGTGENASLMSLYSQTSKTVASQKINGLKTQEKKPIEKDGVWRVYVLMKVPIGEANTILVQKIKENDQLRTELEASKSFKELDAEMMKSK